MTDGGAEAACKFEMGRQDRAKANKRLCKRLIEFGFIGLKTEGTDKPQGRDRRRGQSQTDNSSLRLSRLCGLKIRATTRGLLNRRGAMNAEKTIGTENSPLRLSRLRLLSVLTLFSPHIFGAGPG